MSDVKKAWASKSALFDHASFLTIEKRDDQQHLVEGYASSEDVDLQGGFWPPDEANGRHPDGQVFYEGDLVEAAAIEKALPEYMEWASLHEMHQDDSAVGTIVKAEVIRGVVELPNGRKLTNPFHVIAHVVDPLAWEKVITGVYKGFSIKASVFKLKIVKMADKVVRLIQSISFDEISLVDRPANPGAKIVLWKGANMAKKTVVQKAADPTKAVEMLQELRNEAELAGDLEKAGMYTNAIALAMQANGAEVEVIAEPAEEAEGEHAALGEEPPAEGDGEAAPEAPATEEEKAAALEGLNSEQPAEEEKPPEGDAKDEEMKKAASHPTSPHLVIKALATSLAAKGDAIASKVLAAYAAPAKIEKSEKPADTISKADLTALDSRLQEISKAFSGDIARIASAVEDLSDQVEGLKEKPKLRELPWGGPAGANVAGQPVEILKGLMNDPSTDAETRQILSQKIAQMEILNAQPNYIGFGKR
jgi:hypothetical protein